MSLLADVLGRAKQDINNRASQVVNNATQGVKSTVEALPNQALGIVDNAIGQAANVGMGAVAGAAQDLLRGDLSSAAGRFTGAMGSLSDLGTGALTSLAQLPGQAASNILSGFGITSGSVLSSPGFGMSVSSYSNGGVNPGNGLEGILARPDPLLNFCWYCELPALMAQGAVTTLPWFYVEEANLPFRTYETRTVYREGRNKTYAGKYSVDGLTIALYMDESGNALNYVQAWDQLIIAPFERTNATLEGGGFHMPQSYKMDIPFYLLNVNKQQIAQITYSECWPINCDSFGLQSANSDRLLARLTFSVGDVFVSTMQLNDTQMDAVIGQMTRMPDGMPPQGATIIEDNSDYSGIQTPQGAQTFPVQL